MNKIIGVLFIIAGFLFFMTGFEVAAFGPLLLCPLFIAIGILHLFKKH